MTSEGLIEPSLTQLNMEGLVDESVSPLRCAIVRIIGFDGL